MEKQREMGILEEHLKNISTIKKMAKKELNKRFKGTVLGMFWAVARPILFISLYWFAIRYGLRSGTSQDGVPYIVWLSVGVIAWFFISDTLFYGGNSYRSMSYLVTKMKFPLSIIPTFRILSQWYVHLCLVVIGLGVSITFGVAPSIYWLQLLYYMPLMLIFMVTITFFTSTLVTLSRDFEHLLKTASTFLFWVVPVFWNLNNMPEKAQMILKLNPIIYLMEGYRDSVFREIWFWEKPLDTLYFFAFLVIFGAISIRLYKKISKQFADIL